MQMKPRRQVLNSFRLLLTCHWPPDTHGTHTFCDDSACPQSWLLELEHHCVVANYVSPTQLSFLPLARNKSDPGRFFFFEQARKDVFNHWLQSGRELGIWPLLCHVCNSKKRCNANDLFDFFGGRVIFRSVFVFVVWSCGWWAASLLLLHRGCFPGWVSFALLLRREREGGGERGGEALYLCLSVSLWNFKLDRHLSFSPDYHLKILVKFLFKLYIRT